MGNIYFRLFRYAVIAYIAMAVLGVVAGIVFALVFTGIISL